MALYRVKARQKGVTGYINCLRGTWLGNPFPLSKYTLNNSLLLYKEYLKWRITNDEVFREYLKGLYEKGKTDKISLGCTCNIQDSCHVDILIDQIHHSFWTKTCPGCGGTNTREKTLAYQNDLDNTEDYCNDCKEFFFIIRQNTE